MPTNARIVGESYSAEMDCVVPWRELCAQIEPVYPKPGNGRPPVGVERMLRMYFLQHWFNLSDPAVEEAMTRSQPTLASTGFEELRPARQLRVFLAASRSRVRLLVASQHSLGENERLIQRFPRF
jgi:Transposase domain (DUF772)